MSSINKSEPVDRASSLVSRSSVLDEVLSLIAAAKHYAYQAVNTEPVTLYWQVGDCINQKLASSECGDSVVEELARAIARRYPGLRGFTRPNLFPMRQLFATYRDDEKVSPLARQLSSQSQKSPRVAAHRRIP